MFFCGFLNSGVKKIKKQHQPVELGFDRSLTVGAFNALIDYRYFNQTSTRGRPGRKIPRSEKKDYWKRERESVCFLHSSTGPRLGKGNWSTSTLAGWADWPVPWSVHPLGPENLYIYFFVLFFSNTYARSLCKLICQFWNYLPKVHLIKLGF